MGVNEDPGEAADQGEDVFDDLLIGKMIIASVMIATAARERRRNVVTIAAALASGFQSHDMPGLARKAVELLDEIEKLTPDGEPIHFHPLTPEQIAELQSKPINIEPGRIQVI